jgi:hypothetical protein
MGMLKIARSGLRCRGIAACSQALRSFALQANTQFSHFDYSIKDNKYKTSLGKKRI